MTGQFALQLRLPGALLYEAERAVSTSPKLRIGWFVLTVDVGAASTRYRCFHFARATSSQFEHSYFTKIQELENNFASLDAIVIVKRLDRAVFDVARLARSSGKAVFLDLCDDILHPLYPTRGEPSLAITVLAALAPVLSGITVPSAEMAERVSGYLQQNGLNDCPCHVIPDIAETAEIYAATSAFVAGRQKAPSLKDVSSEYPKVDRSFGASSAQPKRVVWFGNFGGMHSNFGMFSLKSRLKALREVHQVVPIELVIISNNKSVYDALVERCGFPTRYVPWSGSAVYQELKSADVALLTTGTDDFCSVKSSNRILQALACGVPVIADKSAAVAEFEHVILSGSMQRALEACLKPENSALVADRLDQAQQILARYTPEKLGEIWALLLKRAIGEALVKTAEVTHSGLIVVLGPDDPFDAAMSTLTALNNINGLEYKLLVSTDLLVSNPKFSRVLHKSRVLPAFFSGKLRGLDNHFAKQAGVVLGDPNSAFGREIVEVARKADIQILQFDEVTQLELAKFKERVPEELPSSRLPPGPFPQRSNGDGSVDWAFVIHSNARGWILDAICQEIGSRQPASWRVVDHLTAPPIAKNLFFSHFSLLESFNVRFPQSLANSNVFVWYTHPREETSASIALSLELFRLTTYVIFTCESNRALWVSRGLPIEKAVCILGAADPHFFKGHARGGGCVGLSSSFYERKNPDVMVDVIKLLPHRQFTLLGRHWNRYARFEEMKALPNFEYLSAPYRDYPRIYATFDVFLSISNLEGGPIPLIETMMCNVVPVASDTGFAPDLITHGHNGYLFDCNADATHIADLIEQAFDLEADVRAGVQQYSWDRFSAEIIGLVP
jgi:glycosyltransferase involved in cell wall biosynthesis